MLDRGCAGCGLCKVLRSSLPRCLRGKLREKLWQGRDGGCARTTRSSEISSGGKPPNTDEEALSLLEGYAGAEGHAAVYEEWRQLGTEIMAALIRAGEAAKEEDRGG